MKHKTLLLLNFLLILALGLGTIIPLTVQAAPLGGAVSGVVTSPNGYPLPAGTVVKLFEPGSDVLRGQAIANVETGTFSFPTLPNGLYLLKAVPPEISELTQSQPVEALVMNVPLDVGIIALTLPQIIGNVLAPDGVTPHPADITVFLPDGQPFQRVDVPAGTYALGGLPAGDYYLQAYPRGNQPYFRSMLTPVTVTDGVTQTLDLQLRPADLWGSVIDPFGAPVPAAKVVIANVNGNAQASLTDLHGFWSLGGLPAGDYWLTALPPRFAGGLLPAQRISVTLPTESNPYTLTLRAAPKVVTGMVTTQSGTPVVAAQIEARRVGNNARAQTLTDATGAYTLTLSAGLWALMPRPITSTVPASWIYRDGPQFVTFRNNNLPETKTIAFTVITANSGVTGNIQLPDASQPPFTVTVALYSNEGQGRSTQTLPGDGTFNLTLPFGGYKIAIYPHSDAYLGPVIEPVQLPSDDILDLGNITLLARDAMMTGTVVVSGSDMGIEGIPMIAMRPGTPGVVQTVSGPGGIYALAVAAGPWQVQPALLPAQPYLFQGEPASVEIGTGETVGNVDFSLTGTNAVLQGVLVDENGNLVSDADGFAAAWQVENPRVHNGAPIADGQFTIYLPAGTYRLIAHLPPESGYLSGSERLVTVPADQTTTVTLTLRTANAHITGALVDPRNDNQTVTDVPGLVTAWSGSNWSTAPIQTGNGSFGLNVASGIWRVNYAVQSQGYARVGGARNVPVEDEQTVIIGLPVTAKDARIEGTVLAPDGSPLPGALILARGQSGLVEGLVQQTFSREDGSFSLAVPYGVYRLGTAFPNPEWVKPAEDTFEVIQNGVSGGHTLQFRVSDVNLSGTLIVSNTVSSGVVQLFAWASDGGYVRAAFPVTANGNIAVGAYQLGLLSGKDWHIRAVYQYANQYWQTETQIRMDDTSQVLDLTLTGPNPLPSPVVVRFDAAEGTQVVLDDGMRVEIPAGAMPTEGMVTLSVIPIATLPNQQSALTLPYGYALLACGPDGEPLEATFNQNVVIHFTYTEADLRGYPEGHIRPAYFSTTTDTWTFPESYVIDTANNRVTMEISHFTEFALTTSGQRWYIFLPLLSR